MGKLWKEWQTLFSWAPITADSDCSYGIERCLFHVKNVMTNLDSNWKAQTLLCQRCLSSQSYDFSSSHAWMWELDYKESWALKIWCFLNCGVGEDYWDLDCKEIQSVHPKGNQFWIFIRRTDAEAETPILWPLDAKSWLIGIDSDAGKDWGQEKKGTTEMIVWHHQLNGLEIEQILGDGGGQGNLVCCSPRGHEELDTTEWLNWTETE